MKWISPTRPAGRRAAARERGTAYLVALLALVVLTIVGLALAFITQTENQLASNERTLQRVFYAADSGLNVAVARALVNRNTSAHTFEMLEPDGNPLIQPVEVVDTSPFYPILDAPCSLCAINNSNEYSSQAYRQTTYAVASTATRQAGAGTVLAQKLVSTMVDIQPWPQSTDDYIPIGDPAQLAKIRY